MTNPITRILSDTAASRLFRRADVVEITDPGENFRVLHFSGAALRGVSWIPGQKIQIRVEGFTNRTYTPMSWDADSGETSVLAYLHGDGPGSELLRVLEAGSSCQFFGPRGSIDLTTIDREPIFVGDETSFGLAVAWQSAQAQPAVHCFEARHPASARSVLGLVGLSDATLVSNDPAPAEVSRPSLESVVLAAVSAEPDAHLVFTGRAQTIKRVRAALKAAGTHTGRVTAKAYWDENRTGLD